MPKLIMRGCKLRHVTIQDDESGTFCRLHITCDYSKPIRDCMGWPDFDGAVESAKVEGELTAIFAIFEPNGELKKHGMEIPVNNVSDFQVFRVKDGDSKRAELRFIMRSNAPEVEVKIGRYKRWVGGGEAQLRLTYEKQGELPLQGEGDDASVEDSAAGSIASARSMKKAGVQ